MNENPSPKPERIGFWITPPEMYDPLNAEFHFDYDSCPFPKPEGFDGLSENWGSSTYSNPPWPGSTGGIKLHDWVRKAIEEHGKGKTVVLVLPHYVFPSIVAPLWSLNPEVRGGAVRWINPKGKEIRKAVLVFSLHP